MPLTVGCDPEFISLDQNDNVTSPSYSIMDDAHGNIGNDHGTSVGEVRPKHGSPAQVTENIRHLLVAFKRRYPEYKIRAGGGGGEGRRYHYGAYSIGGHIHIGGVRVESFPRRSVTRYNYHGNRNLRFPNDDAKLIYAFDFFIGRRLKKVKGGSRPRGASYGRNGDIEWKEHGFEYRTPPSWITDPYLCEATLTMAMRITEMWKTKPVVFDELFDTRKSIARRRDYDILIPASGAKRDYIRKQLAHFKRVVFSRSYQMDRNDVLELWTNRTKLEELYAPVSRTGGTRAQRRQRVPGERLDLQVCQLKKIVFDGDIESEQVVKVTRFATQNVKIYPCGDFTPWRLQLGRDLRLRANTIYLSKSLRPYLKIKRGSDYRVRFIDIVSRRIDPSVGRSVENSLNDAIFFNEAASNVGIMDRIFEIFDTCIRKKIRRTVE